LYFACRLNIGKKLHTLPPLTIDFEHINDPKLTISIVSHGQAKLIRPLLLELAALPRREFEVILTVNIPEDERPYSISGLNVIVIRNDVAKGFGANHNAAFRASKAPFFAVVNPDIRLGRTDLTSLLEGFTDSLTAVCAPLVINSRGEVEDSARRFPTWSSLTRKAMGRHTPLEYIIEDKPMAVDWVAGMLAVFRREAYLEVGGFDDRRYFMYYEDVDVCYRLNQKGWKVMLVPSVSVVHDAQRASHRNLHHMRWHATSVLRFLTGW
jgi:N-acetylglucosaminyl-diphospho-decaprenol L-rhamnosyltransferase